MSIQNPNIFGKAFVDYMERGSDFDKVNLDTIYLQFASNLNGHTLLNLFLQKIYMQILLIIFVLYYLKL